MGLDVSKCKVKEFKNNLDNTLSNVIININEILNNKQHITDVMIEVVEELKVDAQSVLEWYTKCKDKYSLLDYHRDYNLINNSFTVILDKLSDRFDYFLCLVESRFKVQCKI